MVRRLPTLSWLYVVLPIALLQRLVSRSSGVPLPAENLKACLVELVDRVAINLIVAARTSMAPRFVSCSEPLSTLVHLLLRLFLFLALYQDMGQMPVVKRLFLVVV